MIRCEELATRLVSGQVDRALFHNLQEFRLEKKVNDHGRVYLKGIVADNRQIAAEYLDLMDSEAGIEVRGNGTVIFAGIITRVEILAANQYFEMVVEAASCSYELDIQKKRRSFQNVDLTCEALLQAILSDYPGAGFSIDAKLKTAKLGRIYIQYDETDFEFLQRVAAECHAVLIPEVTVGKPWFHFGIPAGKSGGNLQTACFSIKNDLARYRYTSSNLINPGNQETDFIIYRTEEREQFLDPGHWVEFDGQKLLVYQATVTKIKSELKQECLLTTANGFKPDPVHNNRLVGVVLQGKVIDRQNDQVKVHLAIDSQQDKTTACWFSYASFYTAAGHTGLYIMPELGDTVNLYCPSYDETEAFVINSLREPGKLKVTDINTKALRTSFGKDLIFDEHTITVIGKEGALGQDPQVYLRLHDNGTIDLYSDSNITLDTANNLIINAGANLSVAAVAGLEIACGQCDLNMNGRTTFDTSQFKNSIVEAQPESEAETETEQQEETEDQTFWYSAENTEMDVKTEEETESDWDDDEDE
jgi:hypothetical protein